MPTGQNYFTVAKEFMYSKTSPFSLYTTTLEIANSITAMITTLLILSGTSFDLVKFFGFIVKITAQLLGAATSGTIGAELAGITAAIATSIVSFLFSFKISIFVTFLDLWSALSVLISVLYATIALAYGQFVLLDFFEKTMFTFVLPIGIVMRAFPMTRKTGSSLIAIAIVGYIVYPLTIVMGKGMYDESAKSFPTVLPTQYVLTSKITQKLVLISPSTNKNLSKDDIITWEIIQKGTGTYRIWAGPYFCLTGYNGEDPNKQPPVSPEKNVWPMKEPVAHGGGSYECYNLVDTKNYDSSKSNLLEFKISDLEAFDKNWNDRTWWIAVDAYEDTPEGSKPIGYNRDAIYAVGDQCKSRVWTRIKCFFSSKNAVVVKQ